MAYADLSCVLRRSRIGVEIPGGTEPSFGEGEVCMLGQGGDPAPAKKTLAK